MEDMGSAGETGMVMENGGLRDLNVIWIVLGANQTETPRRGSIYNVALRIRYRTHRRTGASLLFSTLEAAELGAGYQHVGGEVVKKFVSRFWGQLIGVINTHLNDWGYFKGFLWLLLEIIVERDWLGCDDVDECLDKLVFCLTRHNSENRLQVYEQRNTLRQIRCSRPARLSPTLLHSFLVSHSYLGVFATMAVSTPSIVDLQ